MTNFMTGKQVRQSFLDHFAQRGHLVVPSSSLVPDNDPTLMFTNSGMVQFKNNFTGVDTRLKRAVSSQRCVRAGGKHNDLENVGHTARHHTFFEMLGNFSFGDYFKEESLTWGWQWVTEVLKLDPARMCVTVYHDDDEAVAIWKKIGMADKDIIRIASSDNFWTMGDTGPCGPCSEIFYDLDPTGTKVQGGRPGTPEEDGDRWMEIWNHVFTQFDLQKDGSKVPLKAKNIDTGAGLERVMAVVQGVYSNYDTDVFQAIIGAAAQRVGTDYRKSHDSDVSLRVIADHLRAMTFLMVDGVLPSNEGRGYVLRRIMRRAMRHGTLLGMDKPFINELVPTLVNVMGEAYPELGRGASMAMDVIKMEEIRFGKTLSQGLKLLDAETRSLNSGDALAGEVAFKLYDTYGFPLDLTQDALRERGIGVDLPGFESAMDEQRTRARAAHKGSGDAKLSDVWFHVQDKAGVTEFLGYTTLKAESVIQALVQDGKMVYRLTGEGQVVVGQSPFYAESGGQLGDTGWLSADENSTPLAEVTGTMKVLDGVWVHHVKTHGELKVGQAVALQVDEARRGDIARNHTATHLLFAALRKVLGEHVVQRGSRQDDKGTRFDISHPKAVTPEELELVEKTVNGWIWQNLPVVTRVLGKDEAVSSGATAQFGEKYGDEVRVVYIGEPGSAQLVTADLCGGTHVGRTGDIGLFRMTTETSVSAGVRRVEGVTNLKAWEMARADRMLLDTVRATLKVKSEEVVERIKALQTLGKAAGAAKKASPAAGSKPLDVQGLLERVETVNGYQVVTGEVAVASAEGGNEELREAVMSIRDRLTNGVVLLAAQADGRAMLAAGVSKDAVGKVQANAVLTAAANVLGVRGGGRPELAMAGGKISNDGTLAQALAAGKQVLV